jgi:hypothetical protein
LATFKLLAPNDVQYAKSQLSQLIDVLQQDISGSTSRRKYQVFVTGGIGPGVTSSLYQTVYDQDFTLQTANAILDMTVGLWSSGSTVSGSITGIDANGKELFPSQSLMMREKMDIYRQFAQNLLGDSTAAFTSPFVNYTSNDKMDAALFLNFKRLFARDKIKPETFAMKFYPTASYSSNNINVPITTTSPFIFTDVGANSNQQYSFGGQVGNIINSTTSNNVGLMFYDAGIAVLDLAKVCASQSIQGQISAMTLTGLETMSGSFIPGFMSSGSIDNIIDHLAGVRFQSGSLTAVTFQNATNINSTLIFCRAAADEFNYSSNPTFTDGDGKIVVINDPLTQTSFTFITTVGLYDANQNLLAVAKLSRPVEKSIERDLTLRVRLDF